jgi:ABC-type sugar transport system permease subunit
LPEIVFLTIMRYVFASRGYANGALAALGVPPVEWLLPGHALTFATVVLVDAWHVTPVVFLMLLAALTAIPEGILEAAKLDGARFWSRLRFIILPLLWPALVAAVLLRGVDALRVFATPLVLTGVEGVPVLSTYAYHQWSDYGNDGAAAAAAALLAVLSVLLTIPLLRRRAEP